MRQTPIAGLKARLYVCTAAGLKARLCVCTAAGLKARLYEDEIG